MAICMRVSTPAAAMAMTPAARQASASQGKLPGVSGLWAGFSWRRTTSDAAAKTSAATAKMPNAQRQVRKVSTRPPKSGPPKAEIPQTTDRMAISCGQMRVGKYLWVATKDSEIRAPPPKPLITRPKSRMGMLGASAVIVQPIAKMMAATIMLLRTVQ